MLRPSLNNQLLLKRVVSFDVLRLSLNASYSGGQQVPAVKTAEDSSYEKEIKVFETLSNVTKKARIKQPQKPPFVKNLLVGKFDTDILTYPQLEKDDMKNLESSVNVVKNVMKQNNIAQATTFSKSFRQNLSDVKAIGLQASQLMDGYECNVTESCAFLEVLSESNLRNSIVSNEQQGVQILNKFANEQLKIKYLSKLMSGELLSATCLNEASAFDLNSFKTKAALSPDGKTWILNGEKCYVVNGKSADLLVVYAVSKRVKRDLLTDTSLTTFLLDKDSPGVTIKEIDSKGIEIVHVNFDNTPVPVENVIGETHNGLKILTSIMTEHRLSVAPMCIAVAKKMLNNLVADVKKQSDDKNLYHETDTVREKIGEATVLLYAMESALYLTTGLIDNYTDQDIEVEAIICKVFSSEEAMRCYESSLDLTGPAALSESHWIHPLFQEILRFRTINETNDGLKIILALLSLQHAGNAINDRVNKIRNPLYHSYFTFKRMFMDQRNSEDNPKLDLDLGEYLHPSLQQASKQLEYCVKRLEFAAEVLLARYGPEVFNYHIDLKRLANVIIDTYAMTACIGRASRSYCIGLQHADMEITVAMAFCKGAYERVKYNVNKIYLGYYHTNDQNYRLFNKKVFKFKEYLLKHPLARNF